MRGADRHGAGVRPASIPARPWPGLVRAPFGMDDPATRAAGCLSRCVTVMAGSSVALTSARYLDPVVSSRLRHGGDHERSQNAFGTAAGCATARPLGVTRRLAEAQAARRRRPDRPRHRRAHVGSPCSCRRSPPANSAASWHRRCRRWPRGSTDSRHERRSACRRCRRTSRHYRTTASAARRLGPSCVAWAVCGARRPLEPDAGCGTPREGEGAQPLQDRAPRAVSRGDDSHQMIKPRVLHGTLLQ